MYMCLPLILVGSQALWSAIWFFFSSAQPHAAAAAATTMITTTFCFCIFYTCTTLLLKRLLAGAATLNTRRLISLFITLSMKGCVRELRTRAYV